MATKYIIRIEVTDLNNKYTQDTLREDIRDKWMPVSLDLTLDGLFITTMPLEHHDA